MRLRRVKPTVRRRQEKAGKESSRTKRRMRWSENASASTCWRKQLWARRAFNRSQTKSKMVSSRACLAELAFVVACLRFLTRAVSAFLALGFCTILLLFLPVPFSSHVGHALAGTGTVDPADFRMVCHDLGVRITETESLAVYGTSDVNGDGAMSFHEFLASYMGEVASGMQMNVDPLESPQNLLRTGS